MNLYIDRHHCWHSAGMTLTSNPPISVMQCCRCGATGHQGHEYIRDTSHGPFAGERMVAKPVTCDHDCPGEPKPNVRPVSETGKEPPKDE